MNTKKNLEKELNKIELFEGSFTDYEKLKSNEGYLIEMPSVYGVIFYPPDMILSEKNCDAAGFYLYFSLRSTAAYKKAPPYPDFMDYQYHINLLLEYIAKGCIALIRYRGKNKGIEYRRGSGIPIALAKKSSHPYR